MVRIANVLLPERKNIAIALTAIYGIGRSQAQKILQSLSISPQLKTSHLSDQQVNAIIQEVKKFPTEGELRQIVIQHIRRQVDMGSYKGNRRMKNMKVHGQSTRHNNRTRPTAGLNTLYKERKTVANKKRSTDKT